MCNYNENVSGPVRDFDKLIDKASALLDRIETEGLEVEIFGVVIKIKLPKCPPQ